MSKKIVTFLSAYQRYNKGETAGFDAATAEALCAGKDPIAKMVGDAKVVAPKSDLVASVDTDAIAELQSRIAELEGENADLSAANEALIADKVALTDEVAALKEAAKATAKEAKAKPGQPPKTE